HVEVTAEQVDLQRTRLGGGPLAHQHDRRGVARLRGRAGAVEEAPHLLRQVRRELTEDVHQTSTTSSTSTGESSGSTGTPTADRAWRPASPKTSPNSSEAPLATPGWPVKSGVDATNATTFTMRLTRESSPTSARTAASALS